MMCVVVTVMVATVWYSMSARRVRAVFPMSLLSSVMSALCRDMSHAPPAGRQGARKPRDTLVRCHPSVNDPCGCRR